MSSIWHTMRICGNPVSPYWLLADENASRFSSESAVRQTTPSTASKFNPAHVSNSSLWYILSAALLKTCLTGSSPNRWRAWTMALGATNWFLPGSIMSSLFAIFQTDSLRNNAMPITDQSTASRGNLRFLTVATPACWKPCSIRSEDKISDNFSNVW